MRIAVNTRLLLEEKLEGIGWFTHETMRRIVLAHPEHEFIFVFDRAFDKRFVYAPNVTPVVIHPPTRHPLLYRIWFDWLLPRKLKALSADAFISPDGFLALRSNVPALAVIHDLNFEHYPEDLPKRYSRYYRSYFPRFARHAARIATVSEFSRRDIAVRYEVDEGRIDVVYNGVGDMFSPLTDEQKAAARDRFAEGHRYFICVGSLHPRKNIARLLLAFDRFDALDAVLGDRGYVGAESGFVFLAIALQSFTAHLIGAYTAGYLVRYQMGGSPRVWACVLAVVRHLPLLVVTWLLTHLSLIHI